jgi:hypothetical protein
MLSLDYNGAEIRTLLELCEQQQPEYDIHEWNVQNVINDLTMTREEAKLYFFAWLYNPESNDIESDYYDREKVLDKHYKDGYIHTPYVHDEIVIDYSDEDRNMVFGIRDVFEDGYVANLRGGKDYYNLNELKL